MASLSAAEKALAEVLNPSNKNQATTTTAIWRQRSLTSRVSRSDSTQDPTTTTEEEEEEKVPAGEALPSSPPVAASSAKDEVEGEEDGEGSAEVRTTTFVPSICKLYIVFLFLTTRLCD